MTDYTIGKGIISFKREGDTEYRELGTGTIRGETSHSFTVDDPDGMVHDYDEQGRRVLVVDSGCIMRPSDQARVMNGVTTAQLRGIINRPPAMAMGKTLALNEAIVITGRTRAEEPARMNGPKKGRYKPDRSLKIKGLRP